MDVSADYYRQVLKTKLNDLCQKNTNYSLRSFARKLDVSASTLSRVINGQCALSIKSAERIASSLGGTSAEKRYFIDSALEDYRLRNLDSVNTYSKPDSLEVDPFSVENMPSTQALLCFSILELTYTENFDPNPDAIAKRLGSSVTEVREAVGMLLHTGLLEKTENTLIKTKKSIHIRSQDGSEAKMQQFYRQIFQFAADRMPTHKSKEGVVVTLTLPSEPAQIELARKLIEEFAWQLCRTMTSGRMTDVYHLGIFLEPTTRTGEY